MFVGLIEEKKALALKNEQEDQERKDRMQVEEAFKENSKTEVPPHVRTLHCIHIENVCRHLRDPERLLLHSSLHNVYKSVQPSFVFD